MQEKIESIQT